MYAVGIDIGSTSGDVLILDGEEVLSWSIVDTGYNSRRAAAQALEEALAGTDLARGTNWTPSWPPDMGGWRSSSLTSR